MKKVSIILAIALVGYLVLSSTASAGLFGRCVPVDCEYTVKVPIYGEKECVRKYCKWVKDTKVIQVCVDRGYWEEYEVDVPVCKCRPCFGLFKKHSCCCCDGCCECVKTITCKRWVPNIVTEDREVPCWKREIVEETYSVKTVVGYDEEVRTGKKWIWVPRCCCKPVCQPCAPANCCCN